MGFACTSSKKNAWAKARNLLSWCVWLYQTSVRTLKAVNRIKIRVHCLEERERFKGTPAEKDLYYYMKEL